LAATKLTQNFQNAALSSVNFYLAGPNFSRPKSVRHGHGRVSRIILQWNRVQEFHGHPEWHPHTESLERLSN